TRNPRLVVVAKSINEVTGFDRHKRRRQPAAPMRPWKDYSLLAEIEYRASQPAKHPCVFSTRVSRKEDAVGRATAASVFESMAQSRIAARQPDRRAGQAPLRRVGV